MTLLHEVSWVSWKVLDNSFNLLSVVANITVFWDVTRRHGVISYRHFEGT